MKMNLQLMSVLLAFGLSVGCAKKSTPSSASSKGSNSDTSSSGTNGSKNGTSTDDVSSKNGADLGIDTSKLPGIYFDYDQSSVNDDGRSKLQTIATALKGKKIKVTVEGHCDERGSNEYNLALGERRSQSVKSYLQKLGVSSDRVAAISYGEERPSVNSSEESGWSKNRRAELVIAQ